MSVKTLQRKNTRTTIIHDNKL